jgi:hypothetical protein
MEIILKCFFSICSKRNGKASYISCFSHAYTIITYTYHAFSFFTIYRWERIPTCSSSIFQYGRMINVYESSNDEIGFSSLIWHETSRSPGTFGSCLVLLYRWDLFFKGFLSSKGLRGHQGLEKGFNIMEIGTKKGNLHHKHLQRSASRRKPTCMIDYPSYILCLVLQQEHQQPCLNIFLKWGLVLITTITFVSSSYNENKVFYNCHPKDLSMCQTFLFSLWSLSMFAHLVCMLLSNFAKFCKP